MRLPGGKPHGSNDFIPEPVDIADEVGDKFRFGMIIDFVGGADLLNITLVKNGDPVGKRKRFLLVMGDVDRSDTKFALHLFQLIAQIYAQLRVQVGQRFIHTDDRRPGDQRARDRHALLLPAGKLGNRFGQLLLRQVNLHGNLTDLLIDLVLLQLLDLQAEGNIVPDGHGRKQRIGLKDDADISFFNGDMRYVLSLHGDHAFGRINKAGDGAEGGCFTAAGRAEESEEFPFLHIHIDAVQCLKIAEPDHDILQIYHVFSVLP